MRKLFLLLLLTLVFLVNPPISQAHLAGQPPFFLINKVYSNLYPVPMSSLENLAMPQDLAAENYLVNQPLEMELETARLPAPPEVVAKTNFSWDFGDGQKGTGVKATHLYTKPGSYILTIYAADNETPTPQILQSVMLNVLPDKSYKLPKSVIKINNKTSKDPLTDILKFKFGEDFTFDASSSENGSAKILSYQWDFGDRTGSTEPKVKYKYPTDMSLVFPLLRVRDSNGFIADSYVEIENGETSSSNNLSTAKPADLKNNNWLPLIGGGVIILALAAWFFKKQSKH